MKRITPLLLLVCTAFFACAQQRKTTATTKAASITVSSASAVFPMNEYLTTLEGTPYPAVRADVIKNINTSDFVNVLDYGAKGDGKTYDDAAIKKAFNAAKTGVIFPFGKTFLVKDVAHISLTHDLTVYAVGATIKMGDGQGYTWLSLDFKSTSNSNKVVWIGGTFDGNQQNQYYPGNTNSKYNKAFTEDHGRFIGIKKAAFGMFYAVTTINTVVDGPTCEDCKVGVFANSTASGGAPIWYDKVQEQGTYYKIRSTSAVKAVAGLFLNLTCYGGSIGTHYSYPTNKQTSDALNGTLSVHVNVKAWNQAQDAIHIEDCRNNFFYNCDIGSDGSTFTQQRIHLSNQSELVVVDHCNFSDGYVNFNESSHLKLGIVSNNKFTGSKVRTYIGGKPTVAYNNTFADSKKGSNTGSGDALKSYINILDDKGKALGKITVSGFEIGDNTDGEQGDNSGGNDGGSHDTTTTTKGDTVYKYVHDTTKIYLHDTVKTYIHDTVRTNIHDTIKTNIHDTLRLYIHDTLHLYTHDTLKFYVHDTTVVTKTVYVPVHDTVYIDVKDTADDEVVTPTSMQIGLLPYKRADELGLPVGRNRYVVSTGSGLQPMQRYSGKMKFSPSVVWEKKAFPTDMAVYEKKLAVLANGITKEKMPFIALENEPNFEGGDEATYVKMVKVAIKLFEPKGIEVYSGGLTFPALAAYCARLYEAEGDKVSVQKFKDNRLYAANNESIAWITQYIQHIENEGVHISFNFHVNIDDNTLAVLPLVVAKLKKVIKGHIMCGECSFSKASAEDVTKTLNILKSIDKVMLYSENGNGTAAVSFTPAMEAIVKSFK